MKPLQFLPSVMLVGCLLSALQSRAQTNVNVVQSVPVTIAKVTTPVSVTETAKTFTYYPVYLTEAQFDDAPTMTASLAKLGVNGFELATTTSYVETSTGTTKFLLIFKKTN
jgi:hypothetical protein